MNVVTLTNNKKLLLSYVTGVFHRTIWWEVGIGIGILFLLFACQNQLKLLPQSVQMTADYWQSQAWQHQVIWQVRLKQLLPSEVTRLSQSNKTESSQTEAQIMQAQVDQVRAENDELRAALKLGSARFDTDSLISIPLLSVSQRVVEFPSGALPTTQLPILSSQGLLGWIDQVVGQRAHVLLLTDNAMLRLAVSTNRGASGLLINQRGALVLTEVPTTLPLQEGDLVVTLNQLMVPGAVPIGTIRQVTKDASGVVQSAMVQPGVDFGEEAVVWVKKE